MVYFFADEYMPQYIHTHTWSDMNLGSVERLILKH